MVYTFSIVKLKFQFKCKKLHGRTRGGVGECSWNPQMQMSSNFLHLTGKVKLSKSSSSLVIKFNWCAKLTSIFVENLVCTPLQNSNIKNHAYAHEQSQQLQIGLTFILGCQFHSLFIWLFSVKRLLWVKTTMTVQSKYPVFSLYRIYDQLFVNNEVVNNVMLLFNIKEQSINKLASFQRKGWN